jgi:Arc/MetJ family transcription regulator
MSVRLNITMDEAVYARLKKEVCPKRISAFINEAVRARLSPDRQTLDAAYKAASKERWRRSLANDWSRTEASILLVLAADNRLESQRDSNP